MERIIRSGAKWRIQCDANAYHPTSAADTKSKMGESVTKTIKSANIALSHLEASDDFKLKSLCVTSKTGITE
jgi:hypothetical protein